jgi:outer membrane protein with beta-barrel domain
MRRSGFLFAMLLVAAVPASASAGTWSLGPNVGLSVLSSQNSSQTVFAWPGNSIGFMPGLRVGFFQKGAPHEFFVDTGLTYESSNGNSLRVLQATGNMQFNLSRRSSTGTYAAAGLGFWSVNEGSGGTSTSATVPSIGAGLGVRKILRHGHGAVRAEMRLDHYFEDQNAGLDAFNAMYVKLGFDLWMR